MNIASMTIAMFCETQIVIIAISSNIISLPFRHIILKWLYSPENRRRLRSPFCHCWTLVQLLCQRLLSSVVRCVWLQVTKIMSEFVRRRMIQARIHRTTIMRSGSDRSRPYRFRYDRMRGWAPVQLIHSLVLCRCYVSFSRGPLIVVDRSVLFRLLSRVAIHLHSRYNALART